MGSIRLHCMRSNFWPSPLQGFGIWPRSRLNPMSACVYYSTRTRSRRLVEVLASSQTPPQRRQVNELLVAGHGFELASRNRDDSLALHESQDAMHRIFQRRIRLA